MHYLKIFVISYIVSIVLHLMGVVLLYFVLGYELLGDFIDHYLMISIFVFTIVLLPFTKRRIEKKSW